MKSTIKGLIILLPFVMGSCKHKDLCFDHTHNIEVEVEFDWRNAPDANPSSMEVYLYDQATGQEIRYNFSGKQGGKIHLPYGKYNSVCINSDITNWAHFQNTEDIDQFETTTQSAQQMMSYGFSARSIPRANGSESERLALTPEMIWSDRQDDFELKITDTYKKLTLYPGEVVSHYTVDIYDVLNAQYVDGKSLDGVLSGMSEGFYHGRKSTSDVAVTMPFMLRLSSDSKSLHSEFLTFGKCLDEGCPNKLTVYVKMVDGTKRAYTYDVSSQVSKAEDPRHVHIIIHGLELPQPIVDGGGVNPSVNDWEVEEYIVPMK